MFKRLSDLLVGVYGFNFDGYRIDNMTDTQCALYSSGNTRIALSESLNTDYVQLLIVDGDVHSTVEFREGDTNVENELMAALSDVALSKLDSSL